MRSKNPASYIARTYRSLVAEHELVSAIVRVQETDLHILSDTEVAERAKELIVQYRLQVENYIRQNPQFATSLTPLGMDELVPPIVRDMLEAGLAAEVGPMAAVAGTMAQYVGKSLVKEGAREIVVENGGDVYLHRSGDCSVAIFAGESPLSYTVGVKVPAGLMPCGICTSSGTIGHSLSLGDADSVTVLAKSTPLADAVATRLGNEVGMNRGGREGLQRALQVGKDIPGITGVVVICGELLGAVGDIELVKLD
ncbi:UPF0280 family protein [Desulfopila sp. IMCC35008]|uniref:UPF0280 family protein n=1 Tax=Desulfopila sp. IMCC35008 TaxID=2653858 RepID=UPI0013D4A9A7|nr:UPF0280 family protein [Desulfopila sp. IMCC35008]